MNTSQDLVLDQCTVTKLEWGPIKFPIRAVKPIIMTAYVSVTWCDPQRSVRTMEASYATRRWVSATC